MAMKKPYLVTVAGTIHVDTTIAVMANSEEEAAKMALGGVDCDTKHWLCAPNICGDQTVTDIRGGQPNDSSGRSGPITGPRFTTQILN
jgi:hypothetical protein